MKAGLFHSQSTVPLLEKPEPAVDSIPELKIAGGDRVVG
ncbi:hypothetical protein M595_0366 [Lyngbya aestuarii BL J]|uniref:Uncharacterized protein n=1 Tax=Lyngbya aestuarii BL J TaxID=1348334 RepID=U7QRD3_9CYAN|nr:hypothetical protein M595_0366 [Lyngbya aestuarii BL J]